MSNTNTNRTALGTTPSRAIPLDQDEELEAEEVEEDNFHLDSDPEGGMQLDSPEDDQPSYPIIADGDAIPYEAGVWDDARDGTSPPSSLLAISSWIPRSLQDQEDQDQTRPRETDWE